MVPKPLSDHQISRTGRSQLIALIGQYQKLAEHVHLVKLKNNECVCMWCRKEVKDD